MMNHHTIKKKTIEETLQLLQKDGGGDSRSIKLSKMLMGQTLGDKVETETEHFSKTNIITKHAEKARK